MSDNRKKEVDEYLREIDRRVREAERVENRLVRQAEEKAATVRAVLAKVGRLERQIAKAKEVKES